MARCQSLFSKTVLQLSLIAIAVQCTEHERFNSDFKLFKKRLFTIREQNITKMIAETVFSNWTDKHECSIELDAIKGGLMNAEEWAFKGTFWVFILSVI